MATSYVLKALRIFSFEEMLNLSQSALIRPVMLKKAAGEDLIFWSDAPEEELTTKRQDVDLPENVLAFKKEFKSFISEQPYENKKEEVAPAGPHIISTDFVLLNREIAKDSIGSLKKEAVRGYARATEMYVVKSSNIEGAETIRFASTNGVLVDKKQA